MKSFSKVVEQGSFTKAALQLNQPKSTVSRAISRLESDLSVQLIKRSTRAISITEEGQKLYRNIHSLLTQLEDSVESSLESGPELLGTLTIALPEDFAHHAFSTILSEFTQLYPKIQLKVNLSNALVDLTKDNFDLAIRIGQLKDSSLIQRQIGEVEMIPVATREYLNRYGFPKEVEELNQHRVLSFYNENKPHIVNQTFGGLKTKPFFLCNSFPMLKLLALDSQGIAILPNFLCRKEIENKKLISLLPDWIHKKIPLQVIYPYTSRPSTKIRAFIDYLTSRNINYF